MTETTLTSSATAAARVLDALESYARAGLSLRFAPPGQEGFWPNLPLSVPQIRALGLIACAGRAGRSGRELATFLGVGPSAITPVVDRLVEHGYVTRHEDAVDRRIQRMCATSEGIDVLRRLSTVRREILAEVVKRIPPEDLETVERALRILSEATQRTAGEQAERLS
jgi:DNA-binding MarR family transcriptional regulator